MHKKRIKGINYYYASIREKGRVKTIYLGKNKKLARAKEAEIKGFDLDSNFRRNILFVVLILSLGTVLLFQGTIISYFTVFVTPEITEANLSVGFTFQSQDFLPKDMILKVHFNNQTSSLTLEEFLDKTDYDFTLSYDQFYSNGTILNGSGIGYAEELITGNRTFFLDISEFNITLPNESGLYPFNLRLTYNETILKEIHKNVTLNITIPEGVEEPIVEEIHEENMSVRLFKEKISKFFPEKKDFRIKDKPKFRFIYKKIFSEEEKLIEEVMVEEKLKVLIYGPEGKTFDIKTDITELARGEFEIELSKGRAYRPGLYRIKIVFEEFGETKEQEIDFLWGVLAINTHKSIYLENEDAFIGIAVLDDQGHMVCDADVTLEIINPHGTTTTLTTSDETIKISEECEFYGVTNLPDYYAYYTVNIEGIYTMTLTAVTSNGVRTMTDTFEVRKQADFDVERDGPTRIYPPEKYSMVFTIKANKDYNGEIREYVPAGFEITPQNGLTVTTSGDTKTLTWNEILTSGGTYQFSYEFDAPDVSPYLFVLGELEIGGWKEAREWMIASDAYEENYYIDTYVSSVDVSRTTEANMLDKANDDDYGQITQTGSNAEYHYDIESTGKTGLILNVNSVKIFISHYMSGITNDNVIMSHELGSTQIEWSDEAGNYPSSDRVDNITITSDVSTWYWENVTDLQIDFIVAREGGVDGFDHYIDTVWVEVNYTGDTVNPKASLGTNPTEGYVDNDGDGSVTFDLKCSDNFGVDALQLWGNWSGGWSVKATNSSPVNDTYWNVTVGGILDGTWKWGVWCNDSYGNGDWSDTNRTFSVNLGPKVKDVTVIPQKALNATKINITANITDSDGVSAARAMLYYPNGTFWQNASMTNSGDIYYNETTAAKFYPHGTYNVTIFANDSQGLANSSETTWFAPYLNLSTQMEIAIDGSFGDWTGVTEVADNGTDAGSEDDFDLTNVSLANNASYLFARFAVNDSINLSDGTKYYRLFISTNDSTGVDETPEATASASSLTKSTSYWNNPDITMKKIEVPALAGNQPSTIDVTINVTNANATETNGFNWTVNVSLWDTSKINDLNISLWNSTSDFIGTSTKAVFVSDVDNDGDNDIIVGAVDNQVYVYENPGNSVNISEWNWTNAPADPFLDAISLFVSDVDNDGDNDIIVGVGAATNGRVGVFENPGGGSINISEWNITTTGVTNGLTYSVFAGDLDDDGDNDIISGTGGNDDKNYVWENPGNENSINISTWSNTSAPANADVYSVFAGDLDNDGDLDIISTDNGKAVVFENPSGGSIDISEWDSTQTISKVLSMGAHGDLDNDGDLDIAGVAGDKIYILENPGNSIDISTWSITNNSIIEGTGDSIIVSDLDNDGDNDIISLSFGGASSEYVYVWENPGNSIDISTWIMTNINTTSAIYVNTFAADVDNDGDNDIIILPSGGVSIWENSDVSSTYITSDVKTFINQSGNATTYSLNWTPTAGGTYTLMAIADNANQLGEVLENNNRIVMNVTLAGASLPFKYDYRVQINGSLCYVYNYSDYSNNISSCLFDNSSDQMEIGVNLSVINLSVGDNANITFETGSMNPGSYDFAPDRKSFLSYDISGLGATTASLGTNPVPGYIDTDGSITFDLKCSGEEDPDVLKLYGNWSGWHANQTNSSPVNDVYWNVIVNGIPEGTWKWDAWCNDTVGEEDWSDENRTFTVDLTNPLASMGTNPPDDHSDPDGTVTFDLKCSDNFGPNTLQLWGNWTGNWEAKETNSTPYNDTWWNVTVSGIPAGTWGWGVYCNDSSDREDWSDSNRTLSSTALTNCTTITSSGSYALTQNIPNSPETTCINISASDVTFDCQEYDIQGQDTSSTYGIYADSSSGSEYQNITIKNCNVTDWREGIHFDYVDNSKIINVNSSSNDYGLYFYYSDNNTLTNITANSNNLHGVNLRICDNNTLTNITANSNNGNGVYISMSENNQLTNMTLLNNSGYDFFVSPETSPAECNNLITNIIGTDNKPIVYYNYSVTIEDWNNNVSEIILCNADNSVINNVTLNHTNKENNGILLGQTDYTNITNTRLYNLQDGLYLIRDSNNNTLTNITANSNDGNGVRLFHSDNNTLTNITANSNVWGVDLNYADNNRLTNITTNSNSQRGLMFRYANNNILTNSYIEKNNQYGIYFWYGGNTDPNKIYNNLLNNTDNVYHEGTIYNNYWNTTNQSGMRIYSGGLNIGGNYWTHPSGSGFSDDCEDTDNDGFCQDAYNVTNDAACTPGVNCSGNADYLPYSDEYVFPIANVVVKTYRTSDYSETDKFYTRNEIIFTEANVTGPSDENVTDATVTANFTIGGSVENSTTLIKVCSACSIYRGNWTTNETSTAGVYLVNVTTTNAAGNKTDDNYMHLYSGSGVSAYEMEWDEDGTDDYVMENKHIISVFNKSSENTNRLLSHVELKDTNVSFTFSDTSDTDSSHRGFIGTDGSKSWYFTGLAFSTTGEDLTAVNLTMDAVDPEKPTEQNTETSGQGIIEIIVSVLNDWFSVLQGLFQSITLEYKPKLSSLKTHFSQKENPEFILDIQEAKEVVKSIEVEVYHMGKPVGIEPRIEVSGQGKLSITVPRARKFRPGLYSLKVTNNGETYKTEFLWGVVSLNTRKSIYRPGETAEFEIVVLNSEGHSVCGADLSLTVTDPNNGKTAYSTGEGTITPGSECGIYNSNYTMHTEGNHTIDITALIDGVKVDFSTHFLVSEEYDFDIIRSAKSKIDPTVEDRFYVRIDIESLTDAKSLKIREFLPEEFGITDTDAQITTQGDTKILTWNKDLIENKTFVEYSYSVPLVWPYLYELGPAELDYDSETFKEARPWYVAVDPIRQSDDLESGTIQYTGELLNTTVFIDGFETDIETNWTVTANWERDGSGGVGGVYEGDWDALKATKSDPGILISKAVDMSDSDVVAFYVDFYYQDDDCSAGLVWLEYNRSDSTWVQMLDLTDQGDDVWNHYSEKTTDSNYFHSGFAIQFNGGTFASGDNFWVDYVYIIKEEGETDVNKSYTPYENILIDGLAKPLYNVTVIVNVSYYNSSGSSAKGNTNPDLWLEIYNGTDWKNIGTMGVTGTGNFSKSTQDSGVLNSWITQSNRDIRVKGIYIDYKNSSYYDTIEYTDVWVSVNSTEPVAVKDVSVTPQKAKNSTNINITANVTGGNTIDTVKAMIYYPNGTFWQNVTMTNSGDIYWNDTVTVNFYPAGTYNVTIWANDTNGNVNSSETTWFAPYLNLSDEQEIVINGSFEDWASVKSVMDIADDVSGGGYGGGDNVTLDWTYNWSSSATNRNDYAYDVAADSDGIYVAGNGDIGFLVGFVKKLNTSGDEVWEYNSSEDFPLETGYLYAVDYSDGFVYVGGGITNATGNDGNNDDFVVIKINSTTGSSVWAYNWSTINDQDDVARDVVVIDDRVYAAGYGFNVSGDCLSVTYNCNDFLVQKINASTGALIWTYNWTTSVVKDERAYGIAYDDGYVYAVGRGNNFSGTCSSEPCYDWMVQKLYDNNGSLVWSYNWTGPGDGDDLAGGVAVSGGYVYVGGYGENVSVSNSLSDVVIQKLDKNDGSLVWNYNWTSSGSYDDAVNDLVLSNDYIYVAGYGRNLTGPNSNEDFLVQKYNTSAGLIWTYNWSTTGYYPDNALGMDVYNNFVYVSGYGNNMSDSCSVAGLCDDWAVQKLDEPTTPNDNFDIINYSLANNNTYLFARIGVNGSIDLSEGTNFYRIYVSTDDSVGNETSPEGENLPFKYNYRVQVNGSSCYVYNYTDYSSNVSSCLFNYTESEMEIGVNLTVIGLSAGDNANITFETGSSNPGSYDFAPDRNSFLSYDVQPLGPALSLDLIVEMRSEDVDYLVYHWLNFTGVDLGNLWSDVSGKLGSSVEDDRYHVGDGTDLKVTEASADQWTNYTTSTNKYIAVYDNSTATDSANNTVLGWVHFKNTTNASYEFVSIWNGSSEYGSRIEYNLSNMSSSDKVVYLLVFSNSTWNTIDQWMSTINSGSYPTVNFMSSPGAVITALGSFTGSTNINEDESTTYTGNCTCSGGTCEEVWIRIQDNRTGTWSNSVTSHENVSVNVTSYYNGSLSGTSDNYYFEVTGNSSGHYNFRVVCNTTSATEDPSDASLLVVSEAPNEIDSCQELDTADTTYELNQSITSDSGVCLNVTANGITIDGNGYNITFAITGTGTAIFTNGSVNITIKNLQFNQTDTTRVNSYAIHLENSYNNTITNNSFGMYGEDSPDGHDYVIYFVNTTNSTITENSIIVESGCDYCHGIHLTSVSHNITIENNTFNMKGGSYGSAILSNACNNHKIYNNTIYQDANLIGAIRLYNSDNCVIDKATIDVSPSSWARAIDLEYYSDNNTINNTVITTIDNDAIYIYNNANDNKVTNTNITASGASTGYRPLYMATNSHGTYMDNLIVECGYQCLYIASSLNDWEIHNSNLTQTGTTYQLAYVQGDNWLINSTIMTTTGSTDGGGVEIRQYCDNAQIINSHIKTYGSGANSEGIYSVCGDSMSIKDTIINSTNDDDVYFSQSSGTLNFTNVTFADKTWATLATSTLNVHWYLDVYVNDTQGNNINNANVTAYNKNGNKVFNQTTGASGQITRQEVLEYSQDNDNLNYKTPHKINVIKDGYYEKNKTLEIDGNKQITITLINTTLPNVEIISPVNGRTYPQTTVLVNITNSSNVDEVVYNWNGTNATYTNPHNVDFTLGSITLYAYANNTNGTSVDVITFTTSQGVLNLTDCQDLDSPNIIYQLNQSITSDYGMCFEVKADNVTLEGNDYTLTYASVGSGTAIYMDDFDNLTVRNLKMEQTSSVRANSPGIHIQNSKDNNITNNTLDIDGEDNPDAHNYGIRLVNTTNSIIIGNDITAQTTCDYCHGIYLTSNSHNTTIEDNTIYTAGDYARGIYSHTSNNQTIYNNTIDVNDLSGNPVYLYQSNNCVINYTTIDSSGDARGIRVELSDNNVIDNADITTTSLDAIYFYDGSENNNLTNTNITGTSYQTIHMANGCHGSFINNVIAKCSYRCLYTGSVTNNWEVHNSNFTMTGSSNELAYLDGDSWLINNTIMTVTGSTNGEGLEIRTNCNNARVISSHIKTYGSGTASDALNCFCYSPDSMSIKDTTIDSVNDNDVYFNQGTATYNFTNVTFADKAWGGTATATLNVLWYLDVHVNNTAGANLENVNVTSWDKYNNEDFTNLTSSSGWIERQTLQEYYQNNTGSYYYTNYTVNASLDGYYTNFTEVNLTTNKVLYFTLVPSVTCNVDFNMTFYLQAGIQFSEQDPGQVNVSAVSNGNYNVTDNSTSGCGTVNVSIRATGDLENGSTTIGIGNVTVNSTSPDSLTIQLSTTYQLIRSNVPAGTNNVTTLYFWLNTPTGQDPKTYNTTIYIMEERE